MLNLSFLETFEKEVCVRCRSESDALIFTAEMKKQYPEKCRNWYHGETNWHRCEERGYIDYYPYLNKPQEGWGLCWDDDDYSDRNECEIVEFKDILDTSDLDLGEIQAPESSIDSLFL